MDINNFIVTITGPSQSGKSLVMNKIIHLAKKINSSERQFFPQKIKKYTTRRLRLEELTQIEKGEVIDVEFTNRIPDICDLVYQTYGIRYGLATKNLEEHLAGGISPIVVINDIRAVEEIRRAFSGRVLSLFVFRKIPELEDFKKEAKGRGNVTEQEIWARYEKAIAIYRTYIENISIFDHVILNAVEYMPNELKRRNTILDLQLENIIVSILDEKRTLRKGEAYEKISRIFVISGNAASGKDEIVRALLTMGKLEAKVLPKYAMRQQEPEDSTEIICRYIPRKEILENFREAYLKQNEEIETMLSEIQKTLGKDFQKQFVDFKQQLETTEKDEYQRFWTFISEQIKKETNEDIINRYFQVNSDYIDLYKIKNFAKAEFTDNGAGVYKTGSRIYIIYGRDDRLYGCDITDLEHNLQENKRHFVIAASEIGVVNVLKHLFGDDCIRFVYAHSEISASEFEAKASDITKEQKKKEFDKILDNYTKHISEYDHVTIYAKAKLTYEQTNKEEELLDQMFRLLRAY